ncbi:hypothetical protein NEHOM01_1342 [Nematocida homosporus]|uniref:uncharacterized protein n=1 Tax=Nematocida homosporus TaxID=1912981 RepID=UPI002221284A|nr:uncharacterized protein NEHOM01_1342 [Nematocida homosporus]KAI5186253.1 hypothetical protein NEHOM01_1342 [Nematocida homosporus]
MIVGSRLLVYGFIIGLQVGVYCSNGTIAPRSDSSLAQRRDAKRLKLSMPSRTSDMEMERDMAEALKKRTRDQDGIYRALQMVWVPSSEQKAAATDVLALTNYLKLDYDASKKRWHILVSGVVTIHFPDSWTNKEYRMFADGMRPVSLIKGDLVVQNLDCGSDLLGNGLLVCFLRAINPSEGSHRRIGINLNLKDDNTMLITNCGRLLEKNHLEKLTGDTEIKVGKISKDGHFILALLAFYVPNLVLDEKLSEIKFDKFIGYWKMYEDKYRLHKVIDSERITNTMKMVRIVNQMADQSKRSKPRLTQSKTNPILTQS